MDLFILSTSSSLIDSIFNKNSQLYLSESHNGFTLISLLKLAAINAAPSAILSSPFK